MVFAFVHQAPYGQILSTKFQVEELSENRVWTRELRIRNSKPRISLTNSGSSFLTLGLEIASAPSPMSLGFSDGEVDWSGTELNNDRTQERRSPPQLRILPRHAAPGRRLRGRSALDLRHD